MKGSDAVSQVSIFASTGLRSGGGGGQPNSNTGARPSAPFRSNVYQPTEMTMILNGGAVSTSGQSQVHAVYTPLSFPDAVNRACTSVRCCPCHCTGVRERCVLHSHLVCMPGFVYPVRFRVGPRVDACRSGHWRRLLVHHHLHFVGSVLKSTKFKISVLIREHLCHRPRRPVAGSLITK